MVEFSSSYIIYIYIYIYIYIRTLNKILLFSTRWRSQNSMHSVSYRNSSVRKYYNQVWNSVNVILPKCKKLCFYSIKHVRFRAKIVFLRGILLHYFIQKKSAAETLRILIETYSDHALSETTCSDFDFEDKECSGILKKFEDSGQELAESWEFDHTTVSKCLKALGMIQKPGYWVQYELKPRDFEQCLVTCEQLLQRQKKKFFFASNRDWWWKVGILR